MASKQLNVETATVQDLASVPGISGKKAKEIVGVRDGNGGKFTESDFRSLRINAAVVKRILQGHEIQFSQECKPAADDSGSLPSGAAGGVGTQEEDATDKKSLSLPVVASGRVGQDTSGGKGGIPSLFKVKTNASESGSDTDRSGLSSSGDSNSKSHAKSSKSREIKANLKEILANQTKAEEQLKSFKNEITNSVETTRREIKTDVDASLNSLNRDWLRLNSRPGR